MTIETFSDVPIPPGQWVNIHNLLGLVTGTPVIYQNNGNVNFRAVDSVIEPTETNNEFGVSIINNGQLFQALPRATQSLWLRGVSGSKDARVGVLPPDISPFEPAGPPLDFEHELAMGRIPGKSRILKFGERDELPGTTGVFATVWDGAADTYVPPTQARIHNLASSSIEDIGVLVSSGTITETSPSKIIDLGATFVSDGVVAGDAAINDTDCSIAPIGIISVDSETELTIGVMLFPETGLTNGANDIGDAYRVVRPTATGVALTYKQGLDGNRLFQNEFIINNGTTDVPTVKSYLRANRMRGFAAGSANKVVGTITSTAVTDLTVSAQINNGKNQTLMAVQSIPINKRGSIKRWRVALTRKQAAFSNVILRTGQIDGIGYDSREDGLGSTGTSSWEKNLGGFIAPPGLDVWVEMDSDGPNVGSAAGFDIILEDI